MTCGIYKIQNLINNKIYIGQSINIEKRFIRHKRVAFSPFDKSYNYPIYQAIRKYNLDNFIFEIVEKCHKKLLNEKEIFWINFYSSNNPTFGYNLTKGGNHARPIVLDDKKVKEIKQLLKTTLLSQEDIGNLFGVSQRMISGINSGETWFNSEEEYPIRVLKEKEKRFCSQCGIEITKYGKSGLCSLCVKKTSNRNNTRKVERPSKEQLIQELKKSNFTQVAKKYGVSSTAIRKWCISYNISSYAKDYK